MIESILINNKQVELIHEILQINNVEDLSRSLKKYKLSEAITNIQSLLDDKGETVDIPETSSFDYKVFQFLIQAKYDLIPNADEEQTTDIITFMGSADVDSTPYAIKNMDTGYITIGDKTYNENNTKIVYIGPVSPTTDVQYLHFPTLRIICSDTTVPPTPILCLRNIMIGECA